MEGCHGHDCSSGNSVETMSRNNDEPSAVNSAVGRLLSWIAGKDSVKRGSSPADGAAGELLSWVVGKDRKNRK
jgi:hypothetical protein